MIFSNMEYPGKDYRVLVYDSWLGEDFHSLDNPQDGDKIVYREIGADGQPIVTKTEVYSNGEWVEEGSGGGGGGVKWYVPKQEITTGDDGKALLSDVDMEGLTVGDTVGVILEIPNESVEYITGTVGGIPATLTISAATDELSIDFELTEAASGVLIKEGEDPAAGATVEIGVYSFPES